MPSFSLFLLEATSRRKFFTTSSQVTSMSMSKQIVTSGQEFTQEEIDESFEKARREGAITDIMGNPMGEDEIVEEAVETDEKLQLPFQRALDIIKGLQGKILTIVDATYDDKERGKYVKDLMRDAFATQANWLMELTIGINEKRMKLKE